MGRHGTLLVVPWVPHGITRIGIAMGGCEVAIPIVLGSLDVLVVIITVGKIAALAVLLTGWKLGVHPRVRPGIHQK